MAVSLVEQPRATVDDAGLVAGAAAGDPTAFAALVRRHQARVFAVALAITGDPSRAEEVAQEALLVAWRRVGRLREPGRVGAWLCSVARSVALGARRRERRRQGLAAALPEPLVPVAAPRADDALAAHADDALVAEVVAALPPTYREPIVMHYVAGCSVGEIAQALALGEAAVKQRLVRGRSALREALARRARGEASFARAALAVTPGAAFTDRVVTRATSQPPPVRGGEEPVEDMQRRPLWPAAALAAASLAVVAGAFTLARSGPDHPRRTASAMAGTPTTSTRAPAGTHRTEPLAARVDLVTRGERLRAVRARRATQVVPSPPRSVVYDFAGERLGPDEPAEPPAVEPGATLDKRSLRAAFGEVRPAVAACYRAALARQPGLRGTLVARLVIAAVPGEGGVVVETGVAAGSTLADDALAGCALDVLAGLALPSPADGVEVTVHYPYVLEPGPR